MVGEGLNSAKGCSPDFHYPRNVARRGQAAQTDLICLGGLYAVRCNRSTLTSAAEESTVRPTSTAGSSSPASATADC